MKFRIQQHLRKRLWDKTEEQLSQEEQRAVARKHPKTKQTFCEVAAEYLALDVKRDPDDIFRVCRITSRFPGLAEELLKYFPDQELLKEIAETLADHWTVHLPPLRDAKSYREELLWRRDDLSYKIEELEAAGDTVGAMIAEAEQHAAWINSNDSLARTSKPAKLHLHDERIDALATLLSLFANPRAGAPDPTCDWEPEQD